MKKQIQIQIPTNCPSCDAALELVNVQLFCRNSECPAQSSKKIEAFAKKMKIKGLGPKTIEKLELQNIDEIYWLDKEYIKDNIGERLASKLLDEISKTRKCYFETFLAALSIPLIGNTASEKISKYCNSLEEITENKLIEAGIGPKARANIIDWLIENPVHIEGIEFIKKKTIDKPDLGKVCITGKLNGFKNRNEAAAYLKTLGYTVTNTVSKQTTYLVDETGKSSSKRTKAEQLNIPIVTINNLKEISENE